MSSLTKDARWGSLAEVMGRLKDLHGYPIGFTLVSRVCPVIVSISPGETTAGFLVGLLAVDAQDVKEIRLSATFLERTQVGLLQKGLPKQSHRYFRRSEAHQPEKASRSSDDPSSGDPSPGTPPLRCSEFQSPGDRGVRDAVVPESHPP